MSHEMCQVKRDIFFAVNLFLRGTDGENRCVKFRHDIVGQKYPAINCGLCIFVFENFTLLS